MKDVKSRAIRSVRHQMVATRQYSTCRRTVLSHSKPVSFAVWACAVPLLPGKTVVTSVHRGVGPSFIRGRSCAGTRSNTQQTVHTCPPASVATLISCHTECTSIVLFAVFRTDCCPCVLPRHHPMLINH